MTLFVLLAVSVFFRCDPVTLAAPRSLELDAVRADTDSVLLEWSGGGSAYKVYREGRLAYQGKERRYEIAGLNPGYTYAFRIDALNEKDEIVESLKLQTETDKPGRNPLVNLNDLLIS